MMAQAQAQAHTTEIQSNEHSTEGDNKIPQELLTHLKQHQTISSTFQYSRDKGLEHQAVVGAAKSLASQGLVNISQFENEQTVLTLEGEELADNGSPEFILYLHVATPKTKQSPELCSLFGNNSKRLEIAMAQGKKAGYIQLQKNPQNELTIMQQKHDSPPTDKARELLTRVKRNQTTEADIKAIVELKKRKLLQTGKLKQYKIEKGPKFEQGLQEFASELTFEMLKNGSWENVVFKEYNFNVDTLGLATQGGHLHPLLKVRTQFREIFLELGYEEMATNNFVESSFWNFDALFQPQQHPARDAHDTFFLSVPSRTIKIPEDFLQRVKKMHSEGGHESYGWRYDWKEEESRKNILRTHTTAVSSRMLYKLAQQKEFTPKKYFSIDRVYRNEALDATHLAEFHQIEGLVADYNLTLGDLIGAISQFFEKYGITQLRFKPAYNPYTEPSMEIFGHHPILNRWVEIGNSGMFRPEMLLPMGLPPAVRVIAWGLSLERPTMIKYGIDNIRKLVGHKLDLNFVETNPICRLDK